MKKQQDFVDYKLRLEKIGGKKQRKYFEEQLKRRQLIGRPSIIEPWYSLNRNSNIFILSLMFTGIIFLKPITDAINGLRNTIRLKREEEKFLKQLDEEENNEMNNEKK